MAVKERELSEAQTAALVLAYDARHNGGTMIRKSTARALVERGLLSEMPPIYRGGECRGYYATTAGIHYLAVRGLRFTWGKVREVHRIATYAIVEHDTHRPSNVPEDEWEPHVGFHPYHLVDGQWEDTGHGWSSLDEALIACVVWKHVRRRHGLNAALNERATGYIMKMIEADR